MESMAPVLLKTSFHNGSYGGRRGGGQSIPIRLDAHDSANEIGHGLTRERLLAREHLIENAAEGPYIRLCVCTTAPQLFRTHVRCRTHQNISLRLSGGE